jgi:GntR family transcriptional regulator/MocR family aminotransferase
LTSRAVDILMSVCRRDTKLLGRQIEEQLRRNIRRGVLASGSFLPSSRDLAHQLGVSRPVVSNAYAQLADEGFVVLRQGALPRVAGSAAKGISHRRDAAARVPAPEFDFLPAVPDLSSFPRVQWMRSYRKALQRMRDEDFGYRDPHGCEVLRHAIVEYLGRVRGVVAEPDQVVIASGFAQSRVLACRTLRAIGRTCVAVEDPGYADLDLITSVGLRVAPVPVDAAGLQVDVLASTRADALITTPAHQFPTGVVLSSERRRALLGWVRTRNGIVLEDDYDSEFRYDRTPIDALQGLEPTRVIYAGTASKILSPGLRLGWLVVPRAMVDTIRAEQRLLDLGYPRIDQHALAEFLTSGALDQHLRRMRAVYRRRRDALMEALAAELPEAEVTGISTGVHATVRLPSTSDEQAIKREASRRGIALGTLTPHRINVISDSPTLLLGYARISEDNIRAGVRALVTAIRATRKEVWVGAW